MTKHFADEAQHAWHWTECLRDLGAEPLKLSDAYQDQYVSTTGMPANLIESTVERLRAADREVHAKTMQEHEERLRTMLPE